MAVGLSPFSAEFTLSGDNITRFPEARNAIVVVVEVVEVEAVRRKPPSNPHRPVPMPFRDTEDRNNKALSPSSELDLETRVLTPSR